MSAPIKHTRRAPIVCWYVVALLCAVGPLVAQDADFNEDAYFSDTATVSTDSALVSRDSIITMAAPGKRIGFSGEITSALVGAIPPHYFDSSDALRASLSNREVANLLLDVRLIDNIKAFANVELGYTSDSSTFAFGLRELFVDAHINYRIYLRTGKQVLQWGRCNFFNPTDMINVEKKSFVQKIGSREGAYGLRVHIPFGTFMNIYGFIDTKDAKNPEQIAGAGKIEFLAGGTEFAFSMWGKRGYVPLFGLDLSSRLGHTDIAAEMGISYGDIYNRLSVVDSTIMVTRPKKEWVPRVALGLTRMVDVQGIPDRLTLIGEGYYNHGGYKENGFADTNQYKVPANPSGRDVATKSMAMQYLGLYQPNSYGRFYVAFISIFNRFINSSLTLQCQSLINIEHRSGMLTAGLSYTSLSDFSTAVEIMGFVGESKTEYMLSGQRFAVRLTAGLVF
jgi:hypothetical protein